MNEISGVVSANQGHVLAEQGREPRAFREGLKIQGDRHTGVGLASLDLAKMAATAEPRQASHGFKRQAKVAADIGERGHTQKFAHAEQTGKHNVRHDRTDTARECLHIPNMAEKPRKARHDQYAIYRERSGWYLAAWRDFAGLTLEDLSAELGKSKGYVSDLETGAPRPGRPPTRFNRDLIDQVSKIVGTTGGRLIDVNPFELSERMERLSAAVAQLDEAGQDALLDMAERWLARSSAA